MERQDSDGGTTGAGARRLEGNELALAAFTAQPARASPTPPPPLCGSPNPPALGPLRW